MFWLLKVGLCNPLGQLPQAFSGMVLCDAFLVKLLAGHMKLGTIGFSLNEYLLYISVQYVLRSHRV